MTATYERTTHELAGRIEQLEQENHDIRTQLRAVDRTKVSSRVFLDLHDVSTPMSPCLTRPTHFPYQGMLHDMERDLAALREENEELRAKGATRLREAEVAQREGLQRLAQLAEANDHLRCELAVAEDQGRRAAREARQIHDELSAQLSMADASDEAAGLRVLLAQQQVGTTCVYASVYTFSRARACVCVCGCLGLGGCVCVSHWVYSFACVRPIP